MSGRCRGRHRKSLQISRFRAPRERSARAAQRGDPRRRRRGRQSAAADRAPGARARRPTPPRRRPPRSTPPRSRDRACSARRSPSPTTASQTRLHAGQRRSPARARAVSAASATASGRGARRLMAPPPARRRPSIPAGHVLALGRGHDRLAAARAARAARRRAARRVELAHHVVEQQQRRAIALGGERVALGQQQREQREPLLALRAVAAQRAAVAREHEVVAVRPARRVPAREVGRRAPPAISAASSSASPLRTRCAVGDASPSPARPSSPACVAKRARDQRRRAARGRRRARRRRRASVWFHGASASAADAAGAHAARSGRCAARAPRGSCGAVAARAGQSAATNWSRWARRSAGAPLTSSRRSGEKTAERAGGAATSSRRSTGAPSLVIRLGSPGREADGELVRPVVVGAADDDAQRRGAEAHQLALVGGAERARRCSRNRAPSSRFVLPEPFGAVHDRQARADLDVGALIACGSRAARCARRAPRLTC